MASKLLIPHVDRTSDIVLRFSRHDSWLTEKMPRWRKKSFTRAARVAGPFQVVTKEGVLTCADGYLAFDHRGWPYPIAADEFERIYEPADASVERE
jgi:hypothetical protein